MSVNKLPKPSYFMEYANSVREWPFPNGTLLMGIRKGIAEVKFILSPRREKKGLDSKPTKNIIGIRLGKAKQNSFDCKPHL